MFARQSINPELMALVEIGMWRDYYKENWFSLWRGLIYLLRNQFGASLPSALGASIQFMRAARRFKVSWQKEAVDVTPILAKGYAILQKSGRLDFEPIHVARLEQDWWCARREPGRKDPEIVGRILGELYACLYGVKINQDFIRAGIIRARAASIRDETKGNEDWQNMESMLLESYKALQKAIRPFPE